METLESGIKKPAGSDNVTRNFFNANWDVIDTNLTCIMAALSSLLTDGVFDLPTSFDITYNGDLSITISGGKAFANGRLLSFVGSTTLNLDLVSDGTVDIITISITYLPGTNMIALVTNRADSAPPPDENGVALYQVTLQPVTTVITEEHVTDLRQPVTRKLT